jgi:hypothetical protein
VASDATGANGRTRPFGQGNQAAKGLAGETAGLLRKAPASKTKAVAASATANEVGEHAALERHREAGGLRVAQEKQARYRVLYCCPSQCLLC